jgi:hypothetical protein
MGKLIRYRAGNLMSGTKVFTKEVREITFHPASEDTSRRHHAPVRKQVFSRQTPPATESGIFPAPEWCKIHLFFLQTS